MKTSKRTVPPPELTTNVSLIEWMLVPEGSSCINKLDICAMRTSESLYFSAGSKGGHSNARHA
jgi:hypothetical protein